MIETSTVLQTIMLIIKSHPSYLCIVFFISSIISGLPIIGSILPVSLFQFILVGTSIKLGWSPIVIACFILPGLMLGDCVGFLFGKYFNTHIKQSKFYMKRRTLFEKSEAYFQKYGGIAIVLGRITGPLRTIIPVGAGLIGFTFYRFVLFDFFSGIVWCITHIFSLYLSVNSYLWEKIHSLFHFF